MAIGSVCHLSQEEAARFLNYGIKPNCKAHKHLSRLKAIARVVADLSCTFGEESGLKAIIDHPSNGYVWKSRMSGGFNVRQLVRLVQG